MSRFLLVAICSFLCLFQAAAQRTVCSNAQPISSFNTISVPSVSDYSFPDVGLLGCFQDTLHQAYWITFEVTQTGTFEFAAKSKNGAADYDFVLFSDACPCDAAASQVVACNWLGLIVTPPYFATGISPDPFNNFGITDSLTIFEFFKTTVTLQAGKKYYLVLDNISKNGVGFDLFMKGTAQITAPIAPPSPKLIALNGPKAVCAQTKATYSVLADPEFTDFKWLLPNGATMEDNGKSANITWKNTGGKLRFAAWNTCFTDTISLDVAVNALPDVSVPSPVIQCLGDCVDVQKIDVKDKNNTLTNNLYYKSLAGALAANNSDLASALICKAETIWLRAASNAGCFDTAQVFVKTFPNPSVVTQSGGQICKGDSVTYVLTFTGKPPFVGTFSDGSNTYNFSTNLDIWGKKFQVNKATTFQVLTFSETSNICTKKIQGTAVYTLNPSCSCLKDAGTMQNVALRVCGETTVTATHNADQNIAATDGLEFVLHSLSGNKLGTIYAMNPTPDFVRAMGIMYDTTYYISAVAARKVNGKLDLNDPCISVSKGQAVVFHRLPTVSFKASDTVVCKGATINVEAQFTGKAPFFFTYSNGLGSNIEAIDNKKYNIQTVVNQTIEIKNINLEDANLCSNALPQTLNITPRAALVLIDEKIKCDSTQLNYTVTLTIDGGDSKSYQSLDGKGVFNKNIFSTQSFKSGEKHKIGIRDIFGCDTLNVENTHTCLTPCDTSIRAAVKVLNTLSCTDLTGGIMEVTLNKNNVPNLAYKWSNGEQTTLINGLSEGTYQVTATFGNGCVSLAAATLLSPTKIDAKITSTPVDCFGLQNGTLSFQDVKGGLGKYTYSIDNQLFKNDSLYKNLPSGEYKTVIKDEAGCEWKRTVFVDTPVPFTLSLGDDTYIEPGNSVQLKPLVSDTVASYSWSDPKITDFRPTVSPLEPTIYRLTVKDPKGCTAEAIVLVWVEGVRKAYIPNAFSPNGDGNNDSFTVFGGDDIKIVKYLRVFDYVGNMIFEANDFAPNTPDLGWDGTFRGKELDVQRLVFSTDIEYTNGQVLHRKGDVMIVR